MDLVHFYYELQCPICRRTYYMVLEKMEMEGLIKVDKIDVKSSRGTKDQRRWKKFCQRLGYEATPVVMMGPYVLMPWKQKEKPATITDAVLNYIERFEMELRKCLKKLHKYPSIEYRNSYEQRHLSVNPELGGGIMI